MDGGLSKPAYSWGGPATCRCSGLHTGVTQISPPPYVNDETWYAKEAIESHCLNRLVKPKRTMMYPLKSRIMWVKQ